MSDIQKIKELFKYATITEIVSLFQSLLELRDIEPEEALALAVAIHGDLRSLQGNNGSLYAKYAALMAFLQHALPDVHTHVVVNWRLPQKRVPVIPSASKRTFDDSLFDDTAMMPVPGNAKTNKPNEG